MRDGRSVSQVLFGLLPEQTIDARGGVWKVRSWRTSPVHDVDDEQLRRELVRTTRAWTAEATDGGFAAALRSGRPLRVETLDREDGVRVEAFPRTWRCKRCWRLHSAPRSRCECGSGGPHGQLPFVLFHDACGDIRPPRYPRCPQHDQVRMELPGTTNLSEIRLSCPVCERDLGQGFRFATCQCGLSGHRSNPGTRMEFAVHRAASVYTPRTVVMVNAPSKSQMRRLRQAGGEDAALGWVADDLEAHWVDAIPGTRAAFLRRQLRDSGIDEETVERMMRASDLGEQRADGAVFDAAPRVLEVAKSEAAAIALAMSESRQTMDRVGSHGGDGGRASYRARYVRRAADAGVSRVDLVERFPVLTGQYGYTRGDMEPGRARLRTFSRKDGTFVVYGDLAATEALVFRLAPASVRSWLRARGHAVGTGENRVREDYGAVLKAFGSDPDSSPVYDDVVRLVHSLSHRVVRHTAYYAGIDRNALSELLFPAALCFVTFAVPRGDFVLGGLEALFEHDLDTLLDRVVNSEHRCALDPGCASNPHGAACAVCLHLGEPSCRLFNTQLDRGVLFDSTTGYFAVASADAS